ncbi:hypothetical protein F7725_016342 [Dissostichus mawsoni]|uniref:Uncharacterized protein n=1 Tax=Dissostichus mawsoni TaxID=36200 RepID=A0A7J5Z3H7_DISMA|nr:hypothetical protein F7725_016342 [Dissostichus mawsoni]
MIHRTAAQRLQQMQRTERHAKQLQRDKMSQRYRRLQREANCLQKAELQHRRLLIGHHGEISPGGELGHILLEVLVIGAVRPAGGLGGSGCRVPGDVLDLLLGQEAHLALLRQHPPVLVLTLLQERVRGQARRLVVAELQRGDLSPRSCTVFLSAQTFTASQLHTDSAAARGYIIS